MALIISHRLYRYLLTLFAQFSAQTIIHLTPCSNIHLHPYAALLIWPKLSPQIAAQVVAHLFSPPSLHSAVPADSLAQ